MAENEFEFGAEVGLTGPKFSVRFKRKWTARTGQYLEDLSHETGLSPRQIEARTESNEQLEDLVLEGLSKAGRTSDPEYRHALARVVASAFEDDARVDEVEQLVGQLTSLDPFALRVLRLAYTNSEGEHFQWNGTRVSVSKLAHKLESDPSIVRAALARLSGLGMVSGTPSLSHINEHILEPSRKHDDYWATTPWGLRAVRLCNYHRGSETAPGSSQ